VKGDYSFILKDVTVKVLNHISLKECIKRYKEKFGTEPLHDLNGITNLGDILLNPLQTRA